MIAIIFHVLAFITVILIFCSVVAIPTYISHLKYCAKRLSKDDVTLSYRKTKHGYCLYTKYEYRYVSPTYDLISWVPNEGWLMYLTTKVVAWSHKYSDEEMVDVEITFLKHKTGTELQ